MAERVALIVSVGLIEVLSRSLLDGNHSVVACKSPHVCGVLKFIIELVACALLRVLAPIFALAECSPLFLFQVLLNMIVAEKVLLEILYTMC